MMHLVENLVSAKPYCLRLRFNTGEILDVNLEPTLRAKAGSGTGAYRQLLDPAVFLRARHDTEGKTICWDGLAREILSTGAERAAPLDFCPDLLYELGKSQNNESSIPDQEYRVRSSSVAVNDEPHRSVED
ncbi:MAG: hypothetical protein C5B50_30125 [Verrucomicrobia bacterium]|nr:MAG: hypothetical protein C5B50_30125 [Verrucomicrobiota bacterium]